jgi:hypothetical protein
LKAPLLASAPALPPEISRIIWIAHYHGNMSLAWASWPIQNTNDVNLALHPTHAKLKQGISSMHSSTLSSILWSVPEIVFHLDLVLSELDH